jgi:hypothetical protein
VLRFEDEFELELAAERVGTSSITYGWVVTARPHGSAICRARSGAYRDRTGDLRLAKPALSQLS